MIVPASGYIVHQLTQDDLALMDALLSTFGRAFNALYMKLGIREDVLHFDIPVKEIDGK